MPRPGRTGAARRARAGLGVALWMGLCGCAADSRVAGDPLTGDRTAAALPSKYTPGGAVKAPPPAALPAPHGAGSTAALASGAFPQFDGGRELRIGAGREPNATTTSGNTWRGSGASGGVTLNRPEPLDAAPSGSAPGFTPAGGTSRPLTEEQAWAQVEARGATWQRLETWGEAGEWKFSCSVPNRQNPSVRRFYEARANDRLSAMRAVLEQMDREQRGSPPPG